MLDDRARSTSKLADCAAPRFDLRRRRRQARQHKPIGEWNTEEIVAEGPQGDGDAERPGHGEREPGRREGRGDRSRSTPAFKNKTGHIGFLGHGAEVRVPEPADEGAVIGEEITARVEIVTVRDDKPICTVATSVRNAHGEICLSGSAVTYTVPLLAGGAG